MPSPFPGMDPYLETPELWRDVHARFIPRIQDMLNPRLRPNNVARIEMRVFVEVEPHSFSDRVPDVRVETSRKRRGMRRPTSNGGPMISNQ